MPRYAYGNAMWAVRNGKTPLHRPNTHTNTHRHMHLSCYVHGSFEMF